MSGIVPSNPNNALHGLAAWHVFTKGNPKHFDSSLCSQLQLIQDECGKNLNKVFWAKDNFLRGLLTPRDAIPPMKLKKNGEPRAHESARHDQRIRQTTMMNAILNGFELMLEVFGDPVSYKIDEPNHDPYQYLETLPDFSHLYKPLGERYGLHPTIAIGFSTRLKHTGILVAVWK